jgi:hypothetical protein
MNFGTRADGTSVHVDIALEPSDHLLVAQHILSLPGDYHAMLGCHLPDARKSSKRARAR